MTVCVCACDSSVMYVTQDQVRVSYIVNHHQGEELEEEEEGEEGEVA